MSEVPDFSKHTSIERIEYVPPNASDLEMYIDIISEEVESFFFIAHSNTDVTSTFTHNDHEMLRSVELSYDSMNYDEQATLVFDTDKSGVREIRFERSTHTETQIEYSQYSEGLIAEQYRIKVNRYDEGVSGAFFNRYYITRYKGSVWQAYVEHMNIDASDNEDVGNYYSREMTPYDFQELFKDTTEINQQLKLLLVQ
jgi:hypothetical protein